MKSIMIDKNSRYWNDDALMLEAYINHAEHRFNQLFKEYNHIFEHEIYEEFGEDYDGVMHDYAPDKMVALNPVWVEKDHSPCLMITPEIITLR